MLGSQASGVFTCAPASQPLPHSKRQVAIATPHQPLPVSLRYLWYHLQQHLLWHAALAVSAAVFLSGCSFSFFLSSPPLSLSLFYLFLSLFLSLALSLSRAFLPLSSLLHARDLSRSALSLSLSLCPLSFSLTHTHVFQCCVVVGVAASMHCCAIYRSGQ